MLEFRAARGLRVARHRADDARALITSEQSNTSIVFDEELILKVFRRLEPGVNPELELLRFLTERGFENIAQLGGWYAYVGQPLDATLGVLQQYVRGARRRVGARARRARDASRSASSTRLRRLGQVTGSMHAVLGSDSSDPTFAPEDPSAEALALLTATVDEEISRIFVELPEDIEALDPIRGRGEEVRESLALLSHAGSFGKHDPHARRPPPRPDAVGARTATTGSLIDFEGEPARSLAERRRKRSPLRDVAGMLRSFAYAVSAVEILRGTAAPEGWEQRAREEFLTGYNETVDASLLPAGDAAFERLLTVFELEKAVYELRYELNNRPEWIHIPVAGILRMLEAAAARMSSGTRLGDIDLYLAARAGTSSSTRSSARTSRDDGVAFAVWAPNATKVSVVGEWNGWDGRANPMEQRGVVGHLGDGRRRRSGGRAVPLRDHDARGTPAAQVRSVRVRGGAAARQRVAHLPLAARVGRRRVGRAPAQRRAVHAADVDLRGAPRLVAAHARQPAARATASSRRSSART